MTFLVDVNLPKLFQQFITSDKNLNSIYDLILENKLLFAWQKEIEIIY
jgi:hypothetical protein